MRPTKRNAHDTVRFFVLPEIVELLEEGIEGRAAAWSSGDGDASVEYFDDVGEPVVMAWARGVAFNLPLFRDTICLDL